MKDKDKLSKRQHEDEASWSTDDAVVARGRMRLIATATVA